MPRTYRLWNRRHWLMAPKGAWWFTCPNTQCQYVKARAEGWGAVIPDYGQVLFIRTLRQDELEDSSRDMNILVL